MRWKGVGGGSGVGGGGGGAARPDELWAMHGLPFFGELKPDADEGGWRARAGLLYCAAPAL